MDNPSNNQSERESFFEVCDSSTDIVWGVGITECKAFDDAKTKLKECVDENPPQLSQLCIKPISKDRYLFICAHGTP